MYQRLLFLFSVLFISGVSMAQNVMTPNDGDHVYNSHRPVGDSLNPRPTGTDSIQKWVHDPTQKNRIGFNQTNFKSYRINGTSFRLRFPNGYNPANNATTKYPIVVFLHGAGEATPTNYPSNVYNGVTNLVNRENQDQLYWGAQLFEQRINAGEWNGFLLFAQLYDNSTAWNVTNNSLQNLNMVMDTLTKYNGLDPDRVVAMGLSAGGVGSIVYAKSFPRRIASVVSASPELLGDNLGGIDSLVHIPIWMTSGGNDPAPSDPSTFLKCRDTISVHGGNVYFGLYANLPHDTWEQQWNETDIYNRLILSTVCNSAHKAQPLVYFGNSSFCDSAPFSTKLGLSTGFSLYEWQLNTGSGFNDVQMSASNTYLASQAGQYRVRFKRTATSDWSAWTPNPVVINSKKCSVDTAFSEHFEFLVPPTNAEAYQALNANGQGGSNYKYQNMTCLDGIMVNSTETITQDASGVQGRRFLYHSTSSSSSCVYHAGDQVWRTYQPPSVAQNTTYVYSFYLANHSNAYLMPDAPNAVITATINDQVVKPSSIKVISTGNLSWKKYTYIWNSGNNTFAQLGLLDSTIDGNGNDFAIDEISLVKYSKPVSPGGTFASPALWNKADAIGGYDSSSVGVWNNIVLNNNGNLLQDTISHQPALRSNASNSINFNPVVSYNTANRKFMSIIGGLSGKGITHSAASAYIVANFNSLSQAGILFTESQNVGGLRINAETNGSMSWYAGNGSGAAIGTSSGQVELNKPALWTFSKNNNGIGISAGNTQDIRKNGVVVKTGASNTTFKGDSSNLYIGKDIFPTTGTVTTLDASVAEIVYVQDSNITSLTQNRIESYLALKYGTTLGTKAAPVNYTSSDSTLAFWTANPFFQVDVFGIGTDSASGLTQEISNSMNSGSGDGTGQVAKGNLVLTSNTIFKDKQFLMIGNNGNSLAQKMIQPGEGSPVTQGSMRITRNWKVKNTGLVGAVILSFDTTGLGKQTGIDPSSYALLISNSGDTTYSGTVSFFSASAISNKKIYFNGVTLVDGAVFTVITNNLNVALPATWLGFTVTAVNSNALLNWKTANEVNVDTYTVEHSFNGVSFSPVGTVAAKNGTAENDYTYTDASLAPGLHYYRIRRTDKDGNNGYSDIKSVRISSTGANVQVRPNPVVGSTLVLAVSVQQSSKTNIQVMGVDGKVILHENVNLSTGNNLLNLNISTVPPGIYLVQVQLNDEVVTKKFIRER